MAPLKYFGSLIGRVRSARKLTQEKLGQLCELHATTISDIENGNMDPSLTTIHALGRGLGIEPGALVTMAGAHEPQTDAVEPGKEAHSTDYGAGQRQLRFSIVAERTSAGYAAYCPDLPGCAARGDSRVDVERAMREAITAELESRRRAGSSIPEPTAYIAVISVTV